jgi:hypothetical protein
MAKEFNGKIKAIKLINALIWIISLFILVGVLSFPWWGSKFIFT